MNRFLVFSMLILAACSVELSPDAEDVDDTASLTSMQSRATSELTEAGPTTQSVTCSSLWECELCINGTPRNVLHNVCSDGSDTIVQIGPCGQACF